MIELIIYRNGVEITTIKPADASNQQKKIMGDNVVSLSFELNQMVNFQIGDYCSIFGETYYLARAAQVLKKSQYNYVYDMQMVSSQYEVSKAQMMFYDANNQLTEGEFSLTGNAETFIDLIVKNVNRISSGWQKGGVVSTGTKTITFSKVDCGSALAQIATEFETEYYITGKTIHLAKLQTPTPYKFRYGNNKGLYTITRKQVDSTNVITRLYAFGSDKNLPPDYPSSRLRLPGGYTFLIHNLTYTVYVGVTLPLTNSIEFHWDMPALADRVSIEYRYLGNSVYNIYSNYGALGGTITVPAGTYEIRFRSLDVDGNSIAVTHAIVIANISSVSPLFSDLALPYLEKNTEIYGVIEANYINDDIYPHRTGILTAVDATNIYKFSDAGIDFDINDQLLPGLSAKITFNTGQLSGYTFEISHFDDSTKQITILKNKDETALDIPSALIHAAIGDEYVLTDIEMPVSYVQAAEQLLQDRAQEYLDLYSEPLYQYSIMCDPKYFRAQQIKMNIGDIVWLSDAELQIEKYIRVISLNKSLIDEYQYDLELGDVVPVGTLQQIIQNQTGTAAGVDSVTNTVNKNALLNGYLICPTAIDTSAMKKLFVDAAGKIWKEA